MGGSSASTTQPGASPVQPITPQYMQSPGGPPQVDPLSYSDPTNTPDPLIETLKWLVGSSSANNAPKRK